MLHGFLAKHSAQAFWRHCHSYLEADRIRSYTRSCTIVYDRKGTTPVLRAGQQKEVGVPADHSETTASNASLPAHESSSWLPERLRCRLHQSTDCSVVAGLPLVVSPFLNAPCWYQDTAEARAIAGEARAIADHYKAKAHQWAGRRAKHSQP